MHKYRILVGVDHSDASDDAIRESIVLARRIQDAEAHFVHVLSISPGGHSAEEIERLSERVGQERQRLQARVRVILREWALDRFLHDDTRAVPPVDCLFHVRLGSPTTELRQLAVDVDADVLVIGPPHNRWWQRLMDPAVSSRMAKACHVPIIVAHHKDPANWHSSEVPDPPRPPGEERNRDYGDRDVVHGRARDSHISGLL